MGSDGPLLESQFIALWCEWLKVALDCASAEYASLIGGLALTETIICHLDLWPI